MAAVAAPELATQQHTPLQERKGEREEREEREGRRRREGREEKERTGGRRGRKGEREGEGGKEREGRRGREREREGEGEKEREGREERERRGGKRGKRVGQERYSTSCFGPSLRRTVPTSFVGQTLSSHALQSGVWQSSFSAISLHPSPHLSPQLGQQ